MAVRRRPILSLACALALTLALASSGLAAQARTALVIGNNAYLAAPLANAVNDARDMRYALTRLGFEVSYLENASKQQIEMAIRSFGTQLANRGGVGLFYYAGHGLQMDGVNYMVPVDVTISSASDVRYGCVGAELILGKMQDAGNDVNLVIMDACRDNPFLPGRSTNQSGLAKMTGPMGSLIAYATSPGSTAADGDEDNGLYTKHLLRNIYTPGLKVEEMFKLVRIGVVNESGRGQVPWEHSSLMGDFYFVGPEVASQAPDPSLASVTPVTTTDTTQHQFTNKKKQTITFPDGSVLEGTFTNEGKDGFGVLTWSDGGNYVGDFKNGVMHGNGVLTWPDGTIYQGHFENHRMHGQGRINWPDGSCYDGKWFDGLAAGGWFTWPDGQVEWASQDQTGNYIFPRSAGN